MNIKSEEENETPICINWDHVGQWRQLHQVTDKVSCQEYVVLVMFEQKQAKDRLMLRKEKYKI